MQEAHAHAHRNDGNTEIDQDAQRSSAPNPSTLYNDPDLLLAIENGDDELSEMLAHCAALEAKARLLDAEASVHAQMAKALEASASIAGSSAMQKARQKDTKAAETEAFRGRVEVLAQRDCVESLRALEGTVNITAGLFASAAEEGFLICRPREAEAEALQSWQRALAHSMARFVCIWYLLCFHVFCFAAVRWSWNWLGEGCPCFSACLFLCVFCMLGRLKQLHICLRRLQGCAIALLLEVCSWEWWTKPSPPLPSCANQMQRRTSN